MQVLDKHLHALAVPPSKRVRGVPADLERIVLSCLSKSPDDRPASAADLVAALDACRDAHGWNADDARAFWSERAA